MSQYGCDSKCNRNNSNNKKSTEFARETKKINCSENQLLNSRYVCAQIDTAGAQRE